MYMDSKISIDEKKKNQNQNDYNVYVDEENKHYTHDGLIDGIIRFTKFTETIDGYELATTENGVKIASYIPPKNGWDIKKALEYGQAHAYPKYDPDTCGNCANAVRIMIEKGGLSTAGRPVPAYQYVGFLPKIGFKHIATVTGKDAQAAWTKSSAQPGDIAVMAHGKNGHICMYTGFQWISDFKQNGMWVYSGKGTCNIFRYGG